MDHKEKKLDRLFQGLSNDKHCACCGTIASCSHHLIRRKHKLTRWQPKNALPVCLSCHNKIHAGLISDKPFIDDELKAMQQMHFKDFLLANGLTEDEFMEVMIKLYESLDK